MKINADKLREAHELLERVPSANSPMVILSSLRLRLHEGGLTLDVNNLHTSATSTIECQSRPMSSFDVCVEAKRFADFMHSATGDTIEIKLDASKLSLKGGRSRFSLATIPGDQFPEPALGGAELASEQGLTEALRRVAPFAADTDPNMPALTGALLHGLKDATYAVATNRYGMAVARAGEPVEGLRVVFSRASLLLLPEESSRLELHPGFGRFQCGAATFSLNRMEGSYPAWEGVMTKPESSTLVELKPLAAAVGYAGTADGRGEITFKRDGDKLLVCGNASGNEGVIELDDPVELSGTYNAKFLSQGLRAFSAEAITVGLSKTKMGFSFHASEPGFEYVLGSMRA